MKKALKFLAKLGYYFFRGIFLLLPISKRGKRAIKDMLIRALKKFLDKLGIPVDQQITDAYVLAEENERYKQYILNILEIGETDDEFVDYKENRIEFTDEDVKPIAFYLPQFHTIPENDEWWGKGFTEWTNVTKAVPQFVGHYQPHLPYDMPFYDLSNPDALREQVRMAKNYAIYGFCFHYYFFSGKRILERPLDNLLENKDIDMPFCLCWANENWTRRWDGLDQYVLLEQKYSDSGDIDCIADMCRYIKDDRYIKINGKPLVLIYRPAIFPDMNKTITNWRRYCRDVGIGEICLMGVNTYYSECDLQNFDFDETVDFPPWLTHTEIKFETISSINPDTVISLKKLDDYVNKKIYYRNSDIYMCTVPGWDNTPRKVGKCGLVMLCSPKLFSKWMTDACALTKKDKPTGKRFIFVNAWNEWAEGAHLEPDRKYGYAYLQATADAVLKARDIKEGGSTL